MAETLRHLLIQQSARRQESPALTAEPFGVLSHFQLRNRVEGVALGLMAEGFETGESVACGVEGAWAWIAELASACCGLRWEREGRRIGPECLGGTAFNDEAGRQPYHDREEAVRGETPFLGALSHGELLARLRRLNVRLGWDHRSTLLLPPEAITTPEGRGALWSALFAGAPVRLQADRAWDPTPFRGLLEL